MDYLTVFLWWCVGTMLICQYGVYEIHNLKTDYRFLVLIAYATLSLIGLAICKSMGVF